MVAVVNVFILQKPQSKYPDATSLPHNMKKRVIFVGNELKSSGTLLSLVRLPPVLITCVITTLAAMSQSFLDPTLEPHLRKSVSAIYNLINCDRWHFPCSR